MTRRRQLQFTGFREMNITPLMDLTFLLLIVFMITAPMLEYSVDVSPPRLDAAKPEPEESVLIALTRKGAIKFNGQQVSREQLEQRLASNRWAGYPVLIRGDESRPYREVMAIMRVVRAAGIRDVSLLTRPEE